jgi:hypothetical protein
VAILNSLCAAAGRGGGAGLGWSYAPGFARTRHCLGDGCGGWAPANGVQRLPRQLPSQARCSNDAEYTVPGRSTGPESAGLCIFTRGCLPGCARHGRRVPLVGGLQEPRLPEMGAGPPSEVEVAREVGVRVVCPESEFPWMRAGSALIENIQEETAPCGHGSVGMRGRWEFSCWPPSKTRASTRHAVRHARISIHLLRVEQERVRGDPRGPWVRPTWVLVVHKEPARHS